MTVPSNNECLIRYITLTVDFIEQMAKGTLVPYGLMINDEDGLLTPLAEYCVDFSCIHNYFLAGRKYLCAACAEKYLWYPNSHRFLNGVYSVHDVRGLKVACQGCNSKNEVHSDID